MTFITSGVEFSYIPETNGVPIVTDMSSSIMTRNFDVSKVSFIKLLLFQDISILLFSLQFGVVFGGAQKNIGPAGVTVVIIREDLLGNPMKICPSVFDFTNIAKENSVQNTPATFS